MLISKIVEVAVTQLRDGTNSGRRVNENADDRSISQADDGVRVDGPHQLSSLLNRDFGRLAFHNLQPFTSYGRRCIEHDNMTNHQCIEEVSNRRQQEHNEERPHSSLGYQTPSEFAAGCAASSAPAASTLQKRHSRDEEALTPTQPILS